MFQEIKLELFDNKFYSVTGVNQQTSSIQFIDFQYTNQNSTQNSNTSNAYTVMQPNLYIKSIQLKRFDFYLNYSPSSNIDITQTLYKMIYNEINKEYFKIISDLGEKNRKNSPMDRLDINIKSIKEKYENDNNVTRAIISKFISSGSYIATEGRIGPHHWLISNNKTYKYILDHLDTINLSFNADYNLMIAGVPYIIDDNIDDDIILTGRKNDINQPGVHCFILCDSDKNVVIHERQEISFLNKTFSMYFIIDSTGLYPEKQFLKINTRTLGYYRMKKLQRIKYLYE